MDTLTSSYNNISYGSNNRYQQAKQTINDNSTQLAVEGGVGAATFGAIRNSGQIGKKVSQAVKGSKLIQADKQAKLLKIIEKCEPIAKYAKNPIVKKATGVLGGLFAATSLVGSTAKIADTCNYLNGLNPEA